VNWIVNICPLSKLVGIPVRVTTPLVLLYEAVTPLGKCVHVMLPTPAVIVNPYVTPAAVDGPLLLNVTVPLTVSPGLALSGTLTVVVTSAIGVISVLPFAVLLFVLDSFVVVPIVVLTGTGPLPGAVYEIVRLAVCPLVRLVGSPLNVIAPVLLLYVQLMPVPVQFTPLNPLGRLAE